MGNNKLDEMIDSFSETWIKSKKDIGTYEEELCRILEHTKRELSETEASEYFVNKLKTRGTAFEVYQYCMREMRLPAVREQVFIILKSNKDWRVKTAMSNILEVYNEKWEDSELFERYKNEG